MKKSLFLIIITVMFLFCISTALAQDNDTTGDTDLEFDAQRALDWLVSKNINGNYGGILETATAVIFFDEIGYTDLAEEAISYLESEMDEANKCWPQGDCKVKETDALVLIL